MSTLPVWKQKNGTTKPEPMATFSKDQVTVIDHPVVHRDLTILRDKNTPTAPFRQALARIATILAYHSLISVPMRPTRVTTPIQDTTGFELDSDVIVVPILRAGLGLVDGIIHFIPDAKVGHLGMYRDETTHKPIDYYVKLPDGIKTSYVLLVDPMLATGGSADDAIGYLKKQGAKKILFMCLISAPEGIRNILDNHPDVHIVTAAIDQRLNSDAFIVPGLGDAGDRIFGTL
jgi:uracil phosphoribosyltransferase